MVKMGTMCLYGCQRISTVEFWDMSSFLLILTAFSWFLLEPWSSSKAVTNSKEEFAIQLKRHWISLEA